jgi:phosphoenolpyruvate synthase/pyruvate phosphate dikinase
MSKLNKKLMTIIENLNLPPKLKEDIIIYYDRIKYEKTFSNIFLQE